MSTTRNLHWFESQIDCSTIALNRWNLQIAMTVASGNSAPSCNLVWKSRALAPVVSISWKPEYGLAWTTQVPDEGVQIRIMGEWQLCNKGKSFDIDSNGYWQPSSKSVDPKGADWLNVGNVDYSYPGVHGIHIVIGIRNVDTGSFEPIYIDKAALGPGSSGRYQLQDNVTWWLEGGDLTGQALGSVKGSSTSKDFSNPSDPLTGSFEWSTTFLTNAGKWIVSPGGPPQWNMAAPPSALTAHLDLGDEALMAFQPDQGRCLVTFSIPLSRAFLASASVSLHIQLKDKFKKVEVTIEGASGDQLEISYETGGGVSGLKFILDGPFEAFGNPVGIIEDALKQLQRRGDLPSDLAWMISQTMSQSLSSQDDPIGQLDHVPQATESV